MERQFGKLTMTTKIMDSPYIHDVFAQLAFAPWYCQLDEEHDLFRMMGTSPLFDPVAEEQGAPEYDVKIGRTKDRDGDERMVVGVRRIAGQPAIEVPAEETGDGN